jgi:hypothetical protein
MSMPFTRSIRALRTDREWPALTILISALALLGLWLIWFSWASIPLYETGRITNVSRYGVIIALFSTEAATHLQPGQVGLIRSMEESNTEELAQGSPAMVMLVNHSDENGQVEVELASLSSQEFALEELGDGTSSVQIEVDRLSPAQWIWRASGQWIDTAPVTLSPQSQ